MDLVDCPRVDSIDLRADEAADAANIGWETKLASFLEGSAVGTGFMS